jgi:hypothetical protein
MKDLGRYVLDGHEPVEEPDPITWATWLESADRIVRYAVLDGGTAISTIFLGLDHNWGDGPPLLFESMIFGGHEHGSTNRYSTWEEAEAGHDEMLRRAIAVNRPAGDQ